MIHHARDPLSKPVRVGTLSHSPNEETEVQGGKGTGLARAESRSPDSQFPDLSLLLTQNIKFPFLPY